MAKRPNSVIEAEVIEDFERVRLADVADIIRGVTYKKDDARSKPETGLVPVLRANNIQDGALELDGELVYVPSELIGKEQLLREGDIVIATSSGSKDLVGKAAPVRTRWMGSFGAFCAVVRPREDIDPLYLAHFFEGPEYKALIRDKALGVNINNLRRGDLEELSIPLAPLPQQRRIVEAIELQLGRLDAAVARLQGAKARLKRYKQAVLKAAVDEAGVENQETLGALSELVTSGSRGWADYYADSGDIFIRAQNLKHDVLDLSDIAFVQLPAKVDGLRTQVVKHDILITITGANVTKTALMEHDLDGRAFVNQHVALARLKEPTLAPFVYRWLISPAHGRGILEKLAYGAGKPGLNLSNIRDLSIRLPSVAEQESAVARLNEIDAANKELETTLDAQLQQAVRLRQAVLKRAFEGRLG